MPEEELIKAVRDYRYLLNRNYSKKASIKLVGDRYLLKREERSILYRGVSDEKSALFRKTKKTGIPTACRVYIDAFNILFTLVNYLNGRPVFISDDGFLRDAGELRGRFNNRILIQRIIAILFDFLKDYRSNEYIFFLDQAVSNSGDLAAEINRFMKKNCIAGRAETCNSPDHEIIISSCEKDVVCSSDSIIIEKVPCLVFDLSCFLIMDHFDPEIIDVSEFISA